MEEIHIGQQVKLVLETKGITVTEFAKRINKSRDNVYSIFTRKADHSEEGIIHYHAIKLQLIGSNLNPAIIETQYPEIVNIDGEIKGNTSLEIIVHKQKLKVIC